MTDTNVCVYIYKPYSHDLAFWISAIFTQVFIYEHNFVNIALLYLK